MNDTILTWNVTNWVTVLVMAFLGFLIVGAGAQAWKAYQANKAAA